MNSIEVIRKNLPEPLRSTGELGAISIKTLWRAVLLELAATGAFVFYACGTAVVASQMKMNSSTAENLFVALIQGLAISAFVYAISRVSGGHLNPAVTLSMVISKNIGYARATAYVIVQLIGGIAGAAVLKAVLPGNIGDMKHHLGATMLGPYSTPGQGFLFEFIVTAGLLFTIYGTALSRDKTASGVAALSPIPIGYAVTIGVGVAYSFTGGSLNPARSFGPAVVSNTWDHHYIYWLGPLGAAVFVGITERFVQLTTHANETLSQVADPSTDLESGGRLSTKGTKGSKAPIYAIQVILEPGAEPIPMIPVSTLPNDSSLKTGEAPKRRRSFGSLEIPSFKPPGDSNK